MSKPSQEPKKLPKIYDVLDKGWAHLAKPEVKAAIQADVKKFEDQNKKPIGQSSKGGRKTTMSAKFNRCVKSVRKTVRARKGSNKESAAIGICTKSVLHKRGRTMKRYRKGRLTTQKKFRGGATPAPPPPPPPPAPPNPVPTWASIGEHIETMEARFGDFDNRVTDLEASVLARVREVQIPPTQADIHPITMMITLAVQTESTELIRALRDRGVSTAFILQTINSFRDSPAIGNKAKNLLSATVPVLQTGGATPAPPPPANPVYTWASIADYIDGTMLRIGNNENAMTDLENYVIGRIRDVRTPPTNDDRNAILSILTLAIQTKSKEIIKALHERGVRKEFMLDILNALEDDPDIRREIEAIQPVAANLS